MYGIMSWAASKVMQKVDCDGPIDECYSQYTVARSYGGLTHTSKELLAAAKLAEQIFMSNIIHDQQDDIYLRTTQQVSE